MKPPHGMTCAPPSGGTGGGSRSGSNRDPHKAAREAANEAPLPVVLTHSTLLKLALSIIGPLIVLVSGALYFFHQTKIHIADPTIHLARGERSKLETKAEANAQRKEIAKTIKAHVDLTMGQVQLRQERQIKKLGEHLETEQRQGLKRVLNEVKRTREDVRRAF